MSINSMIFLTAFLPVVFVLDRLCVRKTALKNILLLLASLVFYAWGDPVYIVLLLVSIAANYGIGLLLGCQRDESVAAKTVLAAGILVNLGILGYYKYFDFFLRIVNRLTGSGHEMRNIPLPIGISFFTFGAISYLMDLYRGHYEAEKNPLNMALYLSFFPKISVGPIARYRDFGPQLVNRQETVEKTAEGIRRFAYGLGKKVLVANIVGASVDKIYAQDITNVTGVMVWCAAILYAIQIYYDFSGFTDMAIGLGKMFGFDICENFNYPYLSGSIQEFWRRWHISLSSFLRDYLYIPLGGNRKGRFRKYLNLLLTFLASGMWHGVGLHFVFWGGLHGVYQIAGDLLQQCLPQKMTRSSHPALQLIRIMRTFLLTSFAWIFFRADSLQMALAYIKRMIVTGGFSQLYDGTLLGMGLDLYEWGILLIGLLVLILADILKNRGKELTERVMEKTLVLRYIVALCLLAAVYVYGMYGPAYDAAQFIYFQF